MDLHAEDEKVGPDLASRLRRIDALLADGNEAVFVEGDVIIGLNRSLSGEGLMQVLLTRAQPGQGVSLFKFELATNIVYGSDNGLPGSQYDFDELLKGLSRKQCPVGEEATLDAVLELYLHTCGRYFQRTGRVRRSSLLSDESDQGGRPH